MGNVDEAALVGVNLSPKQKLQMGLNKNMFNATEKYDAKALFLSSLGSP